MSTPSPTLLPSVGYVTIGGDQETFTDIAGESPLEGWKVVLTASDVYGVDEDLATIIGGPLTGIRTGYTNAAGVLKLADGSAAGTEDLTWPVSNDAQVDRAIVLSISIYPPNSTAKTKPQLTFPASIDTSLQGSTVTLRELRRNGVDPDLPVDGVPASQQFVIDTVNAAIADSGGTADLVDSNGIIKSSKIQVAAVSLAIPGVLAAGQQAITSFAFERPIAKIQVEVDEPSLAGNIVASIVWEERATGTTHTATATLTALTELTDTLSVTWGHYNLDGTITGAPKPGDLGTVTITSTGSQYGGLNMRVTFLGADSAWPSELAAPGTLGGASILAGVLTCTPGTGVAPNVFVTTGSGGSESPLGATTGGGSVFPVGASIDVSAVASTTPVNVYAANRDNLAATPVSLNSYTYLYGPSGSSLDTTKLVISSANGSTSCSGGYNSLITGHATNFLAADRVYARLQSASGVDLSLAVFDETFVFDTLSAMSFDAYYLNTQTDDTFSSGGQNAYQFQFQPINGTWTWKKHVGATGTTLQTGSLPTIPLSTDWTARVKRTSGGLHTVKVWATAAGEGTAVTLLNAVSDTSITAAGKLLIVAEGPGTGGAARTLKLGTIAVA